MQWSVPVIRCTVANKSPLHLVHDPDTSLDIMLAWQGVLSGRGVHSRLVGQLLVRPSPEGREQASVKDVFCFL